MTRFRLRRRDATIDESLTDRPNADLVGVLRIPEQFRSPRRRVARRIAYALTVLVAVVMIVYLDRSGYSDSDDGRLSFLDCVYYATVSLSTTGYGDIAPVTPRARFLNIVVITPLRVIFLIILIGTTVETLTTQSRRVLKVQRWRATVDEHTIVIGYGAAGRAAVSAMISDAVQPSEIVVVDVDEAATERAREAGLVTVHGDATRSDVLRLASARRAKCIVVATDDDATAVLVILTARQISPMARIVASAREPDNDHLLRQSGADSTVVSSKTAGRLLGVATRSPRVVNVIEDLLTPHTGLTLVEREVRSEELGGSLSQTAEIVLAVVRDGRILPVDLRNGHQPLQDGDRLLCARPHLAFGQPATPGSGNPCPPR